MKSAHEDLSLTIQSTAKRTLDNWTHAQHRAGCPFFQIEIKSSADFTLPNRGISDAASGSERNIDERHSLLLTE
jgi:hypothetical protein